MPGTSGLVVAQELKKIRADLPVAMASGYSTDDLRMLSLEAVERLVTAQDMAKAS